MLIQAPDGGPASATGGPAERIRALELALANPRRADVQEVLQIRSAVQSELERLAELGRDVRAEYSRLDTIDNMLRSRAGTLLARAEQAGGLSRWREAAQPAEDHWWWWLDDIVADRRRQSAKRTLVFVAVAATIVVLGMYLINRFGGTPEQKAAAVHSAQGDQRTAQGDYSAAIEAYLQSLEVIEDQPEIWAALVALYDRQGNAALSRQALARLSELVPEVAARESALAQRYELVQDCESALAHAELAVAADSAYASAYLMRGSALECLGRSDEAMDDFERASELAMEQGQNALYVLARTRFGMLLQMGASGSPIDTSP